MTRELAAYVLEIRIDLKNKIDMLTPTPGMTERQVQKAQTLSTDCNRLEVVLQQFMISEAAAQESLISTALPLGGVCEGARKYERTNSLVGFRAT